MNKQISNMSTEANNVPKKGPKKRDDSWILAVIVVIIFGGIRAYSSWLEKDTQRMFNEIVEKSGGVDNFKNALMGSPESSTESTPKTKTSATTVKYKEGFDTSTSIYYNSEYGILWDLKEEGLEWHVRPINAKSTIMKVRDYNLNILISMNVNPNDTGSNDAWDGFSYFDGKEMTDMRKALADMMGERVVNDKVEKKTVASFHAIRTRTDQVKNNLHSIVYGYYFVYNGNLYTISITSMDTASKDIPAIDKAAEKLIAKLIVS